MVVPIEQHYTKIDGEFVLTSQKEINVSDKAFSETVATLIEKAFAK